MKRVAMVAGLIAVAGPVPAAAEDALLTRLAGDWIGRGIVRTKPNAEPERIYCKLENELTGGGTALHLEGRCALADNTARIALTLTAAGDGHYTGTGGGLGVASRGQATLTATGTADHLEIDATVINTKTQKSAKAAVIVDVDVDGRYAVEARTTDEETGQRYTVSEIIFAAN